MELTGGPKASQNSLEELEAGASCSELYNPAPGSGSEGSLST